MTEGPKLGAKVHDMKALPTGKRILNFVLFVVFLLFAYVQMNDPDPVIWFSIYFLVAILSLVSAFRGIPMILLYAVFAGLVLYSGFHFPYVVEWMVSEEPKDLFGEMSDDKYYIEGTREFLGLLIALLACVYLMAQNRARE